MEHVKGKLDVSERRVCRVIGQPRSTQRDGPIVSEDGESLRTEIIRLASKFGRYRYRRITALLKRESFRVNNKLIERIWREEGLRKKSKDS